MKAQALAATILLTLAGGPAPAQTSPKTVELVGQAMAHTPDRERGAQVFRQACASCHGERAWGDPEADEVIPALAGQREFYLVTQLADIAMLERNVPRMHRVLLQPEYDNPQLWRDVAAHLARQPPNPQPQHGNGRALQTGARVYERGCAQCHGRNGEGSADEPIPALRGQHYSYLLQQLRNFAAGHRSQVEPPVLDFAAGLSQEEMSAVADHLSRLPTAQASR